MMLTVPGKVPTGSGERSMEWAVVGFFVWLFVRSILDRWRLLVVFQPRASVGDPVFDIKIVPATPARTCTGGAARARTGDIESPRG